MKFFTSSIGLFPSKYTRKSPLRKTLENRWRRVKRVSSLWIHNLISETELETLVCYKSVNDIRVRGPKNHAVCIQKCIMDWKVENLDLLKEYCDDPFIQWMEPSSEIVVQSNPFKFGTELEKESLWTLSLKLHSPHNGTYYLSINLGLKELIRRGKQVKIKVSFAIHILSEEGYPLVTREMENKVFSGKNNSHGFPQFLSFMEMNALNLLSSPCLRIRLELYIPGKSKLIPVSYSLKLSVNPPPMQVPARARLSTTATATKTQQEKSGAEKDASVAEVQAKGRSFHVDVQDLSRYPKLKPLVMEDKNNGNLGIICIPKFSDEAVGAMLTYITRDHNEFVTTMEKAVEILRISYEFHLPALAYDMWWNILFLLRLEHIPWITYIAQGYEAPGFVLNYVYTLLLTSMFELRFLKSFHYWLRKEPRAFANIFLYNPISEDAGDDEDSKEHRLQLEGFKREFYARESLQRIPESGQVPEANPESSEEEVIALVDEEYLEAAQGSPRAELHNHNCDCELCERVGVYCQERLYVNYHARIKLNKRSSM